MTAIRAPGCGGSTPACVRCWRPRSRHSRTHGLDSSPSPPSTPRPTSDRRWSCIRCSGTPEEQERPPGAGGGNPAAAAAVGEVGPAQVHPEAQLPARRSAGAGSPHRRRAAPDRVQMRKPAAMSPVSRRAGRAVMSHHGQALRAAAEVLQAASTVAVTCHIGPDGDALGSALGFAGSARKAGKAAVVSFGAPFVVSHAYRFLPLELLVPTRVVSGGARGHGQL